MHNASWSFSTVFRTLPPLASLPAGDPPSDPTDDMLAAVRAAGGCLEFPDGRYEGRWVVLLSGGVLRFASPIGHRLASQGLIRRHPRDVPGHDKTFVRFVPRESLPAGFEFDISNTDKARIFLKNAKQKNMTEEEFLAQQRAARKGMRMRAAEARV